MPRFYDFEKPRNDDFSRPYESLAERPPNARQEGLLGDTDSFYRFKTLQRDIGHFRIDIPEPASYSGLNEYLNDTYAWLAGNCIGRFKWEEGKFTETSLSLDAANYREASRFSIMVTFSHEFDAKQFEDNYRSHGLFKRGRSLIDGQTLSYRTGEGITGLFIRHALKWLPSLGKSPKEKPAVAVPSPALFQLK